MDKIITISRQYASGGRTIGKLVAQELGIPVYDSKIIKDTMKRTGLSEQVVEDTEQRSVNAFLFNLAMGVDDALNHMKLIAEVERDIIEGYVQEGPCVIVGRAANFLLGDRKSLNVFVYSDTESRVAYAHENYDVTERQARKMIERTDKERQMHAMSFYGKKWGDRDDYDLMLNSGRLGIEQCIDLIIAAAGK